MKLNGDLLSECYALSRDRSASLSLNPLTRYHSAFFCHVEQFYWPSLAGTGLPDNPDILHLAAISRVYTNEILTKSPNLCGLNPLILPQSAKRTLNAIAPDFQSAGKMSGRKAS